MTSGAVFPDREEYERLAREFSVVPVTRRLLGDAETPIGVYRKLGGIFLLESAEHGRVWSRYSFVGVRSFATLTEASGRAVWRGATLSGNPDPLLALREGVAALRAPRLPGMPPLTGGAVGYLSYDVVRRLERLPSTARDDLHLPELTFVFASDLAVLDHADASVLLVANARTGTDSYDDALARLDAMAADLAKPSDPTVATVDLDVSFDARTVAPRGGYQAAVEKVKEEILAGEAFQVVLAQRFEMETTATPLDVYRVLRVLNPSPYMYLLRLGDVDVVGSSPEALVKVEDGRALVHPIAGTRPRGATPEEDAALAAELLADPKERAEHVMLVDLGRNDLGRVCVPGSVEVVDVLSVERYSHVMHLVSTIVGEVAPDRDAFDVLTSCFPAGTLSGAPKPRAMEIVESLEPVRRGLYGGAVGYLDFAGDLDTAIAIRTVLMRGGTAYVGAGAGIVADSDPAKEDAECRNKAAAVLTAIRAAETLRPA